MPKNIAFILLSSATPMHSHKDVAPVSCEVGEIDRVALCPPHSLSWAGRPTDRTSDCTAGLTRDEGCRNHCLWVLLKKCKKIRHCKGPTLCPIVHPRTQSIHFGRLPVLRPSLDRFKPFLHGHCCDNALCNLHVDGGAFERVFHTIIVPHAPKFLHTCIQQPSQPKIVGVADGWDDIFRFEPRFIDLVGVNELENIFEAARHGRVKSRHERGPFIEFCMAPEMVTAVQVDAMSWNVLVDFSRRINWRHVQKDCKVNESSELSVGWPLHQPHPHTVGASHIEKMVPSCCVSAQRSDGFLSVRWYEVGLSSNDEGEEALFCELFGSWNEVLVEGRDVFLEVRRHWGDWWHFKNSRRRGGENCLSET